MNERGLYIVLEGHDGTGKTEQAVRLHASLGRYGIRVCNFIVEEPDGAKDMVTGKSLVPVATELRKIIKNGSLLRSPHTNMSMFNDARRENWLQAIRPALDRGETVVTARNWLSTIAYQGYGEGIPIEEIEASVRDDVSEEYMNPDLTLILDVTDHAVKKARIGLRGELESPDTFESKDHSFQDRVRHGYVEYARTHNIPIIDASGTKDEVEALIWAKVAPVAGLQS